MDSVHITFMDSVYMPYMWYIIFVDGFMALNVDSVYMPYMLKVIILFLCIGFMDLICG